MYSVFFLLYPVFPGTKAANFHFQCASKSRKKITESEEKKKIERRKEEKQFNKNCDKDFMMRYKSRLHFDMNQPITVGSKTSTFAQNLLSFSFFSISFTQPLTSRSRFAKRKLNCAKFSFHFLILLSRSHLFSSVHNFDLKLMTVFPSFSVVKKKKI